MLHFLIVIFPPQKIASGILIIYFFVKNVKCYFFGGGFFWWLDCGFALSIIIYNWKAIKTAKIRQNPPLCHCAIVIWWILWICGFAFLPLCHCFL
jgi:hypothetical protein